MYHWRKNLNNSLTCFKSSVIVTVSYCAPACRVGLCHHLFDPSIAFSIGWRLFRSGLLLSHTPHRPRPCSASRQNSSRPCWPHVAFALMDALVATLNTLGHKPTSPPSSAPSWLWNRNSAVIKRMKRQSNESHREGNSTLFVHVLYTT